MIDNQEDFTVQRLMVTFVLLTALACGGSPTEPSGEQHGPEGGGGEAGESGTQYSLTDTAVETRSGVQLTMSYDAAGETFRGEAVNTTSATVTQVRVEIHLSNGVELGPTPRGPAGRTGDARRIGRQRPDVHHLECARRAGQRFGVAGARAAGSGGFPASPWQPLRPSSGPSPRGRSD